MSPALSLPDLDALDPAALKAMLIDRHERYAATLHSRTSEIERLVLLVEKLQRMLFGAKSEKVLRQIDQLELQLEELQAASAIEESKAVAPADRPAPAKPFRRPLPEHLPREVHTHLPGHEACPDCGGKLRELGEDVAEMLEYVRASFKVLRHVRPKLSCDACDRIVQAPAPSRPIDRGLAGPRLLAPLVEAVRSHVMAASKLHADDTPVPVLAPGNGRTKTGRLWTYVRDDRPSGSNQPPAVWFAYSPDRRGEHPQHHLKNFKGVLQADAYAGFNKLYEDGTIRQAPCLAHIRRKFYDLVEAQRSPVATEAVRRIGELYAIEREIRGRSPDLRRQARQARAKPLLASMRNWMQQSLASLSRKSDAAAAIRYALTLWDALSRYVDDGLIEIDNSAAERALRCVSLGRKNSHDRLHCQARFCFMT
jgi:transposase